MGGQELERARRAAAFTGVTIVAYPKLAGAAMAGQGWAGAAVRAAIGADQIDRVLAAYSDAYRAGCSSNLSRPGGPA